MREMNLTDTEDYLHELERNREKRNECEMLMTVPISRFFRDKKLWEFLERQILPDLIKDDKDRIPVLCAGCASGEEVYSLKILWDFLFPYSNEQSTELIVTAIDMNPIHIKRARAGIYPASSLKEIPEQFRSIYFQSQAVGRNRYMIKDSLKKGVSWQEHNLLLDLPPYQFQIIFLRNSILTYYKTDIQKFVLKNIIKRLCPKGFLIIGAHEKLPFMIPDLKHCPALPYIFKRQY